MRRGCAGVEWEGRSLSAHAGQWLIPKAVPRIQSFSEGAEILSIRFRATWPDGRNLFQDGLSTVLEAASHPALERSAKALHAHSVRLQEPDEHLDLLNVRLDLDQHFTMRRRFLDFLLALMKALESADVRPTGFTPPDPRVSAVQQLIQKEAWSGRLKVSGLTKVAALSLSQLERLFVGSLGSSPKQMIDQCRLEHARAQLRQTPKPIKEIALEMGFSSQARFSAWFGKHESATPSAFRHSARKQG